MLLNESNCKPNKLRVDQGKEFYNRFMQKWLVDNGILIYLTHNVRKSVIAERKITANNKNSYLAYLNKLVYQYNNNYHCSICKNTIDTDYSNFSKDFETNLKALS